MPPAGRRGHGPASRFLTEKPKDFKGTLKRLIGFLGKYKWPILLVFVFAIGSVVFSIFGPRVLSMATTVVFDGLVAKVEGTGFIDYVALQKILMVVIAIYVGSALCGFVQSYVMAGVSQRIGYDLRQAIIEKTSRMPFGYFEKWPVGDTLSRITNDVDVLAMNLSSGLTQIITAVVTLVGILAMMFSMNWVMALIVLFIAPFSGLLVGFVVKLSQKHFMVQQDLLGAINSVVEETFSGQNIVRAFNHEDDVIAEYEEVNDRLYNAGWKAQFISSFTKPAMDIVTNLGYVIVAIVGSIFAANGMLTVGDIQAFIQYEKNFMNPIQQLSQVAAILQQMAAAAERIFEFLAQDEEAPFEGDLADIGEANIDFEHVRFGYDPEKPVIKDFSAHIEHGQTVALVGPTGAGKTTIVKLLMRFYDVQGGSIRIGGVDTRDMPRQQVRDMFGMVLQETWLFNGTVRDNLRYGNLEASEEQMLSAAKAGCVNHYIDTLADGFDYVIGEDASNVSQGQRQLLTIARAILANRSMLILDEATSSVDTRTERRIQQAMDNLMEGRTCFVIAHRLSTIRNADLILVIKDGDIVEQGNHDELLAANGFYAELYNSQFEE